ncbi:Sulfite reductase [NADPH] flavoprotein component [Hypsizygus marmoreus]|uniref:assimilatory sulfite reductase (NADPH) n=1 Tax=Hypsizygus marmoreus TaxID=39966 RepID=A0A369JVY9_HYPMA|nr:Sulfite reductase [NADPH] flavoprotein component [Hypsizygus marmoreus]
MTFTKDSGTSTPFSSTATLSSPPSPRLKVSADTIDQDVYYNPRISASTLVEYTASRSKSTSTVYIYDLAEQAGFGTLTKEWSKSRSDTAPVVDLQTRAGAGLSLIGRLSEGTSRDTVKGAVLTTFTTPAGLSLMVPSLHHLPIATPTSRLVIQVPNVTPVGETFSLSPSLSALATAWPFLPEGVVVLISATPQQTSDFAALSYELIDSHVIHIFDQHSSSRETGHLIAPLSGKGAESNAVAEVVSGAGYKFFDFFGDAEAHTAIVLLNGPLALAVAALANRTSDLAVIVVNVLRPWDESALLSVLPSGVSSVHVVEDVPNTSTQGGLYIDVFGTILDNAPSISVHGHRITPSTLQGFFSKQGDLSHFISSIFPALSNPAFTSSSAKKILLLSNPRSSFAALSRVTEDLFFASKGIHARSLTDFDVFSKPGGIAAHRLLLSPKNELNDFVPLPIALPLDPVSSGEVDFLAILDHSLLKSHSVLQYAQRGAPVLVITTWSLEEFASNIPSDVASLVLERELRIFTINAQDIALKLLGDSGFGNEVIQIIIAQLAFLRLYLGAAATEASILGVAKASLGDTVEGIPLVKINAHAWSRLEEIDVLVTTDQPLKAGSPLKTFEFNAIAVETEGGDTVVNGARLSSWHDAAKHLLFPAVFTPPAAITYEEFPQNPALRPEIPDRTYLVTCSVNRRLTPLEYDRNVFHLEFDTTGTGLKYSIGEALGVHGWNDEKEVLDFCTWYGVDPDRLVSIPIVAGEGKTHTRTVLQALQQQIDLFGHPPKSFYTDLAAFATSSVDRHALLFIGSPEGSATYKKLSEKDTVTFADILQKYSSARPGIEKLCELIGDIKPRHYSIASAQSVVGNRVDLLVVTVDWLTPSGTPRYGQCTRYLAGLHVGQKVTVSIKPSVMKLPPNPSQPIILAGLGTGAAPFRAFFQHLAWLASQGQEIGPVYYYFGSRHQSSEYLYGEEIEAFILDGIISKAGLAFSRDGAKKVYIQHKMLEDSEALAQMLHDDEGVFYLCGPTWPVPDVYEALVNALVKYKGADPVKAGEYLESLKEEERYVLEVY